MITNEELDLAKILWDYHHVNHEVKKSDCIFVMGSHDPRVANRAAELYFQEYAPYIIFSGGLGYLTKEVFDKAEAEIFADIARKLGVPEKDIYIENKSTNSGENIKFTKELLKKKNKNPQTFIIIQKPYMERRSYATFKKQWPEKKCVVTSPQISFEEYPTQEIRMEKVIEAMVGDLQRIRLYEEKGFQIFQEVPENVWSAYERLVKMGFTGHLI